MISHNSKIVWWWKMDFILQLVLSLRSNHRSIPCFACWPWTNNLQRPASYEVWSTFRSKSIQMRKPFGCCWYWLMSVCTLYWFSAPSSLHHILVLGNYAQTCLIFNKPTVFMYVCENMFSAFSTIDDRQPCDSLSNQSIASSARTKGARGSDVNLSKTCAEETTGLRHLEVTCYIPTSRHRHQSKAAKH